MKYTYIARANVTQMPAVTKVRAKFHYTGTDRTGHVRACELVSDNVWSGPSSGI